ncbi:type 1 glutamine amidotransferase [Pelagicoccus sp. SDUM812002]|uniref:type 1 glutamine amidotransferase n=1 Tax=Pelagicoccus sp. SDUM812002 TaxID=3041266 RepID=UPI00280DE75F|nr:type 1 glutamine amidotransferase [Pelagicoccus sp. SDUM812002]MDQ8184934.1 type 1 glutamine amidotransferase [Pelagicoccus sp. SDUM812002]
MSKLLIIDPLDLSLKSEDGSSLWSSRSCFEACLRDVEGLVCEYTTAKDAELCRRAMKADGVILGGSEASAWVDTVFNDHLLDLIAICKNNRIPLFAICYGAQLLGRALGGHVSRHPEGMELGAPAIRISEKGKQHFVFEGIGGGCIWSVETHNDAVMTLPPKCELLASTAHTPVQAFSYDGLLTGVQFHPEMDSEDLRYLWQAFEKSGFVENVPTSYQQRINACECERQGRMLQNFAKRVRSASRQKKSESSLSLRRS